MPLTVDQKSLLFSLVARVIDVDHNTDKKNNWARKGEQWGQSKIESVYRLLRASRDSFLVSDDSSGVQSHAADKHFAFELYISFPSYAEAQVKYNESLSDKLGNSNENTDMPSGADETVWAKANRYLHSIENAKSSKDRAELVTQFFDEIDPELSNELVNLPSKVGPIADAYLIRSALTGNPVAGKAAISAGKSDSETNPYMKAVPHSPNDEKKKLLIRAFVADTTELMTLLIKNSFIKDESGKKPSLNTEECKSRLDKIYEDIEAMVESDEPSNSVAYNLISNFYTVEDLEERVIKSYPVELLKQQSGMGEIMKQVAAAEAGTKVSDELNEEQMKTASAAMELGIVIREFKIKSPKPLVHGVMTNVVEFTQISL